jgi:uncharacterized membrane protein YfcA
MFEDMMERFLLAIKEESHFNDDRFVGAITIEAWRWAVTTILCWLITSCAVAAGIGGGGLLVPLYSLVLGVGTKHAIPISQATIFGVACGNVLYISRLGHPKANRPLIDYATVVLMQPGELMGVIVGVLMNRFLPEVIIIILLVLVLGFTAYKTLCKGVARWRAETKEWEQEEHDASVPPAEDDKDGEGEHHHVHHLQKLAHGESAIMHHDGEPVSESDDEMTRDEKKEEPANSAPDETAQPIIDEIEELETGTSDESSKLIDVPETSAEAQRRAAALKVIEDEKAIQFPRKSYIALVGMTTFLIVYSLLLNQVIIPGFDNCDLAYWPLYWSPVLVFGAIMWYFARQNISRYGNEVELGFTFVDGDLQWDKRTVSLLAPAAVAAGVAAGLLGIGGGMVLGPLFVALNFQPQVGTASTGFMILFTALSGTVQYLALGKLPWRYALWFGSIGAIGGQTGQRVVESLIDRTGRPSIVVILLACIIGIAVIIMAASGSVNVAWAAKNGENIWEVNTDLFVCNE